MEEICISKAELTKRGFRKGKDGIFRKASALEQLAEKGWLDFGDKRFSANDRKSIGERFASDYMHSRVEGVSALDVGKIRVDGSGNLATPEDISAAEDRYRKALKTLPSGCMWIVRRVCIKDLGFILPAKTSKHQKIKERARQATLLCLGLDELGKFYAGLRGNNG